jgi:hypothetical protein
MDEKEQLDYLMDNKIDEADEQELYDKLAKVDGIIEYLKKTMAKDIQRYFSYTPEQQPMIRGSYLRTEHFLRKIVEAKRNKEKKLDKK